ncbi:nucleotidyltransferase family protein [Bacillus dakarensis]|uniref:nucleotidyltransferase domain-containing protein n=1 Tax=Robertmurraya dakarensis TaxID=1926278 RepID=UPI0009820187|nr:nucleotidyltransferase family protein [Bacillus dakarensis]
MEKNLDLNTTKIPNELNLIFEILKTEEHEKIPKERYVDIDWELFLQQAFHHRLYPLLYSKLNKNNNSLVPANVFQTLADSYRENTFRMLHLCGEMDRISKLFLENDIRPLFLKGPTLAADLYEDISKRTCGDLDILVPLESLHLAEKLLINIGYEKDEYIKSFLNDWKWRHHHFTYYHKNGTKIEIHWRLNPAPSKEPSFKELWKRKRETEFGNTPIYTLGYEDLFYFLVSHGARHGWSRLRWLTDIHQILMKDLKWENVLKVLRMHKAEHIAGQALILSASLINSKIPNETVVLTTPRQSKKLAQDAIFYLERMINLHSDPVPKDIAKYHSKHLFTLMSKSQRFIYLLTILHPYYTDIETFPLPKKLHFLYFPLRPFLWAWRKTKKLA